MGDENPIRTLGDYSKPSHEGYKNTIKLPAGNNVCEIDRTAGGKLCNKKTDESWEIIKNLALYDHEGWNETKEFVKLVKAISTPQGSDVNVMPYSTYMKLTNERPAKTDSRLSLASHLYIYPLGIAEDVLVEIAEHVYPIDFVILDIRENKNRPFILGTPFLTTAKASIKFDTSTITLRSRKLKVSFHRILYSSNVTDKGVKNDIEPITPTMTVNRLVLEWEEKIKLHLEKEMQFNQWRSKNFKGMHPTLIATNKLGIDKKKLGTFLRNVSLDRFMEFWDDWDSW
ncbi:reverse transcriptase domain-containing protein [Tanacetum coccineum]